MDEKYQLYCCGSRGSRPVEGIHFNEFGGFTSCYVLKTEDYALIIDCGTGLYEANSIILDCPVVDVVLTHMHYDHVLGMLDWDTLNQKSKITFYAGFNQWFGDRTFYEFFRKPFWPVQPSFVLKEAPPEGEPLHLREDLDVFFYPAPHPDDSRRIIIRHKEKNGEEHSICVLFDNENPEGIDKSILRDCDYLIYDGMYTDAEYPKKKGYGHSTWQEGVRLASAVNCKRLIITHHSPFRTDSVLRDFEAHAREIYPATDFARSGQHWPFPNRDTAAKKSRSAEKTGLKKRFADLGETLNNVLLDDERLQNLLSLGTYLILGAVSALMTVVNIFTDKRLLMCATLVFAVLCFADALVEYRIKKYHGIVQSVFQVQIIALIVFFVVSGTPEGFSVLWVLMLPIAGMLVFSKKRTIVLCCLMEIILMFFFYTPVGRGYLQYEYTQSFMLRFPMAFAAFCFLGWFLAALRERLLKELDRVRNDQAKTIATQTAELRAQYFDIIRANSKLKLRNEMLQSMLGEDVSDDKLKEMLPNFDEQSYDDIPETHNDLSGKETL